MWVQWKGPRTTTLPRSCVVVDVDDVAVVDAGAGVDVVVVVVVDGVVVVVGHASDSWPLVGQVLVREYREGAPYSRRHRPREPRQCPL